MPKKINSITINTLGGIQKIKTENEMTARQPE